MQTKEQFVAKFVEVLYGLDESKLSMDTQHRAMETLDYIRTEVPEEYQYNAIVGIAAGAEPDELINWYAAITNEAFVNSLEDN